MSYLTFPSHSIYSPTHAGIKSTTYVHWKGQQQVFLIILHGKKKTVSHFMINERRKFQLVRSLHR